jgi:hypothetical protein
MASHLIRRSEVARWLRDSVVPSITIHRTSVEAARRITEEGVAVARTEPDSAWGQGFYSSSIPDPRFGEIDIRVAVRLQRPLIVPDAIDSAEIVEDIRASTEEDDVRQAILAAGYDGVLVHYGPGDFWAVAYWDHQVKVVQDV